MAAAYQNPRHSHPCTHAPYLNPRGHQPTQQNVCVVRTHAADFGHKPGISLKGCMENELDANEKPVLKTTGAPSDCAQVYTSSQYFDQWYSDSTPAVQKTLIFTEVRACWNMIMSWGSGVSSTTIRAHLSPHPPTPQPRIHSHAQHLLSFLWGLYCSCLLLVDSKLK
jgi:hypothetical protein